ncbi:unnamed protein product, partial [Rotaria sordida]
YNLVDYWYSLDS